MDLISGEDKMNIEYWTTVAEAVVISPIALAMAYYAWLNPTNSALIPRLGVIVIFGGAGLLGVLFLLQQIFTKVMQVIG